MWCGVTELVTVIRTKLRCHILLARGGPVHPGEGGEEFLYSNCGHDNRSRQTVVSLCNSNSSKKFCAELSYIHSQPSAGQNSTSSNVNILYGEEERRETSKKIK